MLREVLRDDEEAHELDGDRLTECDDTFLFSAINVQETIEKFIKNNLPKLVQQATLEKIFEKVRQSRFWHF